ncbi:Hypothetical predicted protein [Mytilus galloprovincialis]|uniref:Uncharacterized protein n=1 Tax=Mytilus galloprovincialis TaxID=29158 RepID=A0A8B6GXL5_MYTGA|nr:Hypothetical predicted protein [Mytilus galloprovincialis]
MSISVASSNAKQSTALFELEEAIDRTLLNVKECKTNRETAIKEIEKQECEVRKMIFETRKKVNLHLNKLEKKLLNELRSSSRTWKSKHMEIIQWLESTEEMIAKLSEQTLHMKQLSSDIQVFLGTRQVHQVITSKMESIKREIGDAKDYEMKLCINSMIKQLPNELETLGEIKVTDCNAKLDFRDPKIGQAQTRIISDTKLQVIKTFQTCRRSGPCGISSCVILPNGHLLTSQYTWDICLVEHSDTGEYIRDVPIPVFKKPYDIAVIDRNRIAVTYGEPEFLEIMNLKTCKIERRVELKDYCWGVCHENGRLYVRSGNSTMQVINLSGGKRKTFQIESNDVRDITTSRDRLYYTDNEKVYCCRLNGDKLWQFPLEGRSIEDLCSIAVDIDNNVYVLCDESNNLTYIHHNGRDSRLLLTEYDGLLEPHSLYYDREKNTMRICNRHGLVWLYNVV